MRATPVLFLAVALGLVIGPAAAQRTLRPPAAASTPATPLVQGEVRKVDAAMGPLERQKLMQDLCQSMENARGAMHGMWGPGMMGGHRMMHGPEMMGGPAMMGWGGMHAQYSKLTPEQMRQRHYTMDQYMGMQQTMLDHIMQRQQWMTLPSSPTGK